jgi:3-hydroxy-9,10-secoandrosta-1,3,5(10)-triene-9,17-dione monooxygenase reductase component
MPTKPDFDSRELRRVLGAFATGVTVITIGSGDDAYGMTANSFASVSLDPPLILVCVQRRSAAAYLLKATNSFAVNILSEAQAHVSDHFAHPDRPRGAGCFDGVPHRIGASGAAVLAGAAGHLDCRVHALHEAGDHLIVIGEVIQLSADAAAAPLVFHRGRYERLAA